ncbi:hypothetical protein BC629DRAFT_1470735 [Irpex lacteus]|nr:hypothetical protein BC629DRAFT_1470735 [Irpex lacteus]
MLPCSEIPADGYYMARCCTGFGAFMPIRREERPQKPRPFWRTGAINSTPSTVTYHVQLAAARLARCTAANAQLGGSCHSSAIRGDVGSGVLLILLWKRYRETGVSTHHVGRLRTSRAVCMKSAPQASKVSMNSSTGIRAVLGDSSSLNCLLRTRQHPASSIESS